MPTIQTKASHRNHDQNVKTAVREQPHKASFSKLVRTTFRTSREMDFFSEKELVTQTGHAVSEWPFVAVKELIDNALDACEEANIAPIISVTANAESITVSDNGPGLPEATLKAAFDFTVRASNREAYVAPDRGAQGNALKTLIPMPLVIDREHGKLMIEAHGKRHTITCGPDAISQRAIVHDQVAEAKTKGTRVTLKWAQPLGSVIWPFGALDVMATNSGTPSFAERFRGLVEGFSVFNPHASIRLDWFGNVANWKATDTFWKKWKPCHPTSPHWYEAQHLIRLIGAYITHDRDAGKDRLVSDLLQEFDGLSGSHRRTKVLEDAGMKRLKLSDFVIDSGLDSVRIAKLLSAMQRHTRSVKASRLGIIGENHLRARLIAMGVQPDSFTYKRTLNDEGLPYVMECAFGWLGEAAKDNRKIVAGANWSAAINNPFRTFGNTGEGLEAVLNNQRAGAREPIVFVVHLAHPRVEYTDRGKSALVIAGGDESE